MIIFRYVMMMGVLCFAGLGFGAPHLPLEIFFRDAEISSPRISQDGTKVVFLMRNQPARKSIAVYDVRTRKGNVVFVPNDYNVDFAFWKGERIVFGGDAGGNESYALRSIKGDGSSLRDLSESTDRYRFARGPIGGNVFSILPDDPEYILVSGYGTRRNASGEMQAGGEYGLYRLHVSSGRRLPVERWADDATGYFVDDRSGRVFGRSMQDGAKQALEIRDSSGKYRRVASFAESVVPWQFAGLLPGERQAILQVRDVDDHDRGALYVYDRQEMKRGALLYEPGAGEIAGIRRDKTGRIVGIFWEAEKMTVDWFDAAWAKLYANLQATFPNKEVAIVNSTDDLRLHVVHIGSDQDPGAYYLFDSVAPELTLLGRVNSSIEPAEMAAREPISFDARDGLKIHGYLTRPADASARTPLIVLPHGGPFGIRDSWVFDPEAQFLANRGYAVLQVNYRGSGGYGAKFQAAGKRQWGLAMQNDLTDSVRWAIAQGVTSADRVGIYGASYGGYAVLAGLVYTPELYQCGANYVGVSDLRLLKDPTGFRTSVAHDQWVAEWIGSAPDYLRAQSPVEHIQNIRVPSLHAYGENDPRVDIGHWRLLERELKRYNKPYVFIRERDEGHGFEDERSRSRFYAELEKFLMQHLPVMDDMKMPAK